MSFDVPVAAYDRFMGRYSSALAPLVADFADAGPSQHVLDVGCGPGSLTEVLLKRGCEVTSVDPSPHFVAALRERFPDADAHEGSAEALPFPDNGFDRVVAQLVVHHMADPVAGIREMARVANPGGMVAACVWDHVGGRSPLGVFWRALERFDPGSAAFPSQPGTREGELVALFAEAGLADVEGAVLSFDYPHSGFDDWWAPFEVSPGPVGRILAGLDDGQRRKLSELCREGFPEDSEPLHLSVWAARAVVDQTM